MDWHEFMNICLIHPNEAPGIDLSDQRNPLVSNYQMYMNLYKVLHCFICSTATPSCATSTPPGPLQRQAHYYAHPNQQPTSPPCWFLELVPPICGPSWGLPTRRWAIRTTKESEHSPKKSLLSCRDKNLSLVYDTWNILRWGWVGKWLERGINTWGEQQGRTLLCARWLDFGRHPATSACGWGSRNATPEV